MNLKIENLSKLYGSQKAISDLSLELNNISSLVLIGPSGSGKTTLLRILAGLETPEMGKIKLNEHQLHFDAKSLLEYRRTIGVVFQSFNLFPHWTALENIVIPLIKVHGFSKPEAMFRANELLERFDLSMHKHKKPFQLSGGQKQRIALCRAVSLKPEILLLDEPTSALDPELTTEVLELIEELKRTGIEFILVTHEMGFAASSAEKVVFLDKGKVLDYGSPKYMFHAKERNPRIIEFMDKILKYEQNI